MFKAPLESRGINTTASFDEVEDIEHARTYLRIGSDGHKKIWHQLKSLPDSAKWPNMFLITNLLLASLSQRLKLSVIFHPKGY